MAQEKKVYHDYNGMRNVLKNWGGEVFATDPIGSDLYVGRKPWYNPTDKRWKFFDGTVVQTQITLEDLKRLGTLQNPYDASASTLPVADDGSIQKGDHWRVGTAGTMVGIGGGDEVLEVGDLIFAKIDGASVAGDFFALQMNLNLPTNLSQAEMLTVNLTADTAFDLTGASSFTNIFEIRTWNSSDEPIEVYQSGPLTARELESSEDLTGIKVYIVGN